MIACPSCHRPLEILEKHWGALFTCPHCNAVSFVNFNGQIETASEDAYDQSSDFPQATDNFSTIEASTESNIETHNEFNIASDRELGSSANEYPDYKASAGFETQSESTPFEAAGFSQTVPDQISSEDIFTPSSFDSPVEETPLDAPGSSADTPDLSDITDFANDDKAVGALTYVVVIAGIDSNYLMQQLREAMTDSRFGWDVPDLLNQVVGGKLTLAGLTPVKASVLINRIKYLPFKISWRQGVLSIS